MFPAKGIVSDAAGTSKVSKVKKGTWLDQVKAKEELGRKPLSAHQQRQLAHTAAGQSVDTFQHCFRNAACGFPV